MIRSRYFIIQCCISIVLVFGACQNKSDQSAVLQTSNDRARSPFFIKMGKVDNAYIKEKHEIANAFFIKNWIKNNVSGGFLVAKNGEIIYENYQGDANIENKSKITATTPIHIASVSKVLTASVILRLIDSGQLQLNQNINTILSPFPYPNITIQTLLNHRSGLPNYAYFCDDRKVWNHSKLLSNQDVLDLLNLHKFPLQGGSDKRFAYCNTNYVLLALIIEKVTKMNYRDAMQKLLFEPLKMDHTFVLDCEKDKNKVSQSYKGNKMRLAFDHLDGTYGDKNIYSTPRDLLKFDKATYAPAFLSVKLVESVYKGYSYEHKGTRNYGLGIRMYEWESGQKMFYHNGWWHGNTASYIKLKQDTVAIFALSNKYTKQTFQSWKLAPDFGDYPFKLDNEEGEQ